MRSDPETGCTCLDETTRRCPVHSTTTEFPCAPVVCASCGKDREVLRSGPGFAEYKRCKYCGCLAIIAADKWKPKAKRLNSLLPRVTLDTLDAVLNEIYHEPDEIKQKAIIQERLDLLQRENAPLYNALCNSFPQPVVAAVAFVYRALAAQGEKDARWPS